ncbi:MAG: hypothetical protein JNG90_04370, partial [Planctomycetaceae bacterium]|nr:hypothetical protein [Planctomycetaceae bacterium]
MPSSRNRPPATRLALRLDEVARPLALIAASGEIEFANRALAEWLGVSASDLIGITCRYHSSSTSQPLESLAAAICPPPQAFAGSAAEATVQVPSIDTARRLVARVQFIPLHHDSTAGPILALLTPEAAGEASPAPASEALELHAELQRFRQRVFRDRTAAMLGKSP